jgi:hypothetical protein
MPSEYPASSPSLTAYLYCLPLPVPLPASPLIPRPLPPLLMTSALTDCAFAFTGEGDIKTHLRPRLYIFLHTRPQNIASTLCATYIFRVQVVCIKTPPYSSTFLLDSKVRLAIMLLFLRRRLLTFSRQTTHHELQHIQGRFIRWWFCSRQVQVATPSPDP